MRLVSATLGLACLNALSYELVTPGGTPLPPSAQVNLLFVTLVIDTSLIVMLLFRSRDDDGLDGASIGARAFLLPLPTWQVVLARISLPAITAAGLWVALSGLVLALTPRSATGETWPLLGPALVASVASAWSLALFALPLRPRVLRGILATGTFLFLGSWTLERFGGDGGALAGPWDSPTPGELGFLAGLLLVAYGTALLGTRTARRGGVFRITPPAAIPEFLRRSEHRTSTFRSPLEAQVWFEWRGRGRTVPLVAFGILLLAGLGNAWSGRTELLGTWLLGVTKILLVLAPLMIGCVMGRLGTTGRHVAIDTFRGSRPLGNADLTRAVLTAGSRSLLCTWFVIAATVLALCGVADALAGTSTLSDLGAWSAAGWSTSEAAAMLALGLLASWGNMAAVATVFLTGRKQVIVALVFLPYLLGLSSVFAFGFLETETVSKAFLWVAGALSLLLPVGAAAVFVRAWRKRLIGLRGTFVAVSLWAGCCLLLLWHEHDRVRGVLDSGYAVELASLALVPALLAALVASLAAAPLATAWNRHR